ncbi:MAG: hypothetical protein U0807_08015 [Candidatus Binatia bacterium]
MKPPEGRVLVGETVTVPGGRRGTVVAERQLVSNGAWRYAVELDGGGTVEHHDYELRKVAAR